VRAGPQRRSLPRCACTVARAPAITRAFIEAAVLRQAVRPCSPCPRRPGARWSASEAVAAAPAELGSVIEAAVWELRRRELEALIGAPPLPDGWVWHARFDVEQTERAWVLRSTLLPVPDLEGDEAR
jgi:hypothetical protein